MEYVFRMEVEEKEETPDDAMPGIPTDTDMLPFLSDLLLDQTKHDERIGWRITRVRTDG